MKHPFALIAALCLSAASAIAGKTETRIDVIPYPQSVELGKGVFKADGAAFYCDPRLDSLSKAAVTNFANKLSLVSGKMSTTVVGISTRIAAPEKGFVFLIDSKLEPSAYTLDILPKCVKVTASDFHGIFYAIQTIKQILPAEIYGNSISRDIKWTMPVASIKDQPRFGYRGMHLDCSRHFFSVDEVKRYLNIMSVYKLNTLHWHLTDDQGWRVEIKKYPLLTQIGAYRAGTAVKRNYETHDGIVYGGYYTQDEMRDIVRYASSLGITIIPEIDLPGHMLGVLSAYPQLGCTGGPYQVWTRWGISKDVLCPGKEAMFTFLEDVFTELMDIFPSEYIHIGGDECPKERWKECPDCQARIKELGIKGNEKHTAEQYLQNYVTARVQKFLNEHGRKIIGWDEVLEGDLAEGATVMSWRGTKGGIKAAEMGYDVIMTPNTYCYFDYYQCKKEDRAGEPYGIGGELPVEKVYGYEPYDELNDVARKHLLGVQANLWTEFIPSNEHLEYMLLPRMAALSEVQWCPQGTKDLDRFMKSLEHAFKIYDALGLNYSRSAFGKPGFPGMIEQ